jgi:hypothetical protein
VRSLQPLVQSAPGDRSIGGGRTRGSRLQWRAGRDGLPRRGWSSGPSRRCIAGGLPVGDKVLVTGTARPWRGISGLASSPVRPMIGHRSGKLSARPETKAEAQNDKRQSVPFEYHGARCVVPGFIGDGLISWRDCDVSSLIGQRRQSSKSGLVAKVLMVHES